MVTGKCFDKGPEILAESGNGGHSKWRSLNSTLNFITFPYSCHPFIQKLYPISMIKSSVGEQLLIIGIYLHLELSLKLQSILVCSQFLLSIVPNNGCKVNKHFLLLLARLQFG